MLPQRVLYYGKDEALPESIELRAGPLTLLYEDGDIRSVRFAGSEVIRRIYVAVRDRNWGTVVPVLSDVQVENHATHFRIRYHARHQRDEIDFSWSAEIRGEDDGTLTFSMDGQAHTTFLKNRIGFCVLHPAGAAGAPCQALHTDGRRTEAVLPRFIDPNQPVQPFTDLTGLAHQVLPGVWAELRFSGDAFEMEDQRNWTDASFKTFCTPLRLPFPVEVPAGARIAQQVRLSLRVEQPFAAPQPASAASGRTLALEETAADPLPLPALGLGCASHGRLLNRLETERLKRLRLHHLRVDLDLTQPDNADKLARAAREAAAIGAGLEVALLVPPEPSIALIALSAQARTLPAPVKTWLVLPTQEQYAGGSPTAQALETAQAYLYRAAPGAVFASGSNADLIFLQRNLPPLDPIQRISFSINPQVHAFDNKSLVETLEAQAQCVETARHRAGGMPVMVSPLTLKARYNAYATGPAAAPKPGELPAQVDVRQMSLFGAGWTLGSLAWLSSAGVASLTCYETTGWRGVMELGMGSPLPALFRSFPGGVFPLYFPFAALAPFAGGEVLPFRSGDPLSMNGMVVRKDGRQCSLAANHTPHNLRVRLPVAGPAPRLHRLDESNALAAMQQPESFLAQPGEALTPLGGGVSVELPPYALAWVES